MNHLRLIATIIFSLILGANAFSYKDAKDWGKQYPKCNGKSQSPITIKLHMTNDFPMINQTLTLKNFQKLPKKMTIKNTGHTVEMKVEWSGEAPTCTGGPLHGNYVYEKTTFHWAQKKYGDAANYDSAQATFSHDMEMQMIFYKTDFKSFEKAESHKGGLAIFKIELKGGYNETNHLFDNLEKIIHKVQSINSSADIVPFRFASIFDDINSPSFLFYEGSLEYPPCSESVTWLILEDGNAFITEKLLSGFRKVKLAEGDVSNIRPFQALNKRTFKNIYTDKYMKAQS